jgi:hypothetical protein
MRRGSPYSPSRINPFWVLEDGFNVGKIYSVLRYVGLPFILIPFEVHILICIIICIEASPL